MKIFGSFERSQKKAPEVVIYKLKRNMFFIINIILYSCFFICKNSFAAPEAKYEKKCTINFYDGNVQINDKFKLNQNVLNENDLIRTTNGQLDFGLKNISAVRICENTVLLFKNVTEDGLKYNLVKGKILVKNKDGFSEISVEDSEQSIFTSEGKAEFSIEVSSNLLKAYVYDGLLKYIKDKNTQSVSIENGTRVFIKNNKFKKEKYKIAWDKDFFETIAEDIVEDGSKNDNTEKKDINESKDTKDLSKESNLDKIKEKVIITKEQISDKIRKKKEEISKNMTIQKEKIVEEVDKNWENFKTKIKKEKEKVKEKIKKGIEKI